ncbi:MAG: hypothetical protein KC457_32040, partial [Myxococcales bacterium]|nr:hypothetical protein [Myxococcales bacterium]
GLAAAAHLSARERENLVDAKRIGAERVMRLFALSVYPALDFDDELALQEAIDRLTRDPEVVAVHVWSGDDLAPRASFERAGGADGSPPPPPPRPTPEAVGEFTLEGDLLRASTAVRDDHGTLLGHAVVDWSLTREQEALDEARRLIVGAVAITVTLVIIVVFLAMRLIVVRPLLDLESAAMALGRGQQVAIRSVARDEIGRLSRVFATMADAIADREARLRRAHDQIAALFDNMRQAIVTVGPDGRIVGRVSHAATVLLGRTIEPEPDDDRKRHEIIVRNLEDRIRRKLGVQATLKTGKSPKGPGTIELPYKDLDELQRLLHVLLGEVS